MHTTDHHILERVNRDLEALHQQVLGMGTVVIAQLVRTVAHLKGEAEHSVAEIVHYDQEINRLQMVIDAHCHHAIARYQPMASDLRLIIASMRVINDLERIGDQTKQIARQLGNRCEVAAVTDALGELAAQAILSVERAVASFQTLDSHAAVAVVRDDATIDHAFRETMEVLTRHLHHDPQQTQRLLELMWCAHAFERIGDYARNISESAIYLKSGFDARHASADELAQSLKIDPL